MTSESEDDGIELLDERQATRLVILREVTKATVTKGAMASTGLAYAAGELMFLCEWVENGMAGNIRDAMRESES